MATRFSVSEFRANLNRGGARPTLFEVEISIASLAGGVFATSAGALDKLKFTCQAANLPASQIGTIEVPFMGRKIRLPGDRIYPDWTVTIMNDEDFSVRDWMENWSNLINEAELNLRVGPAGNNPASYKCSAYVTQFSKTGEAIRRYRFDGLYPSEVGAIDLSWETTDTIETFPVTFQYDFWQVEPVILG